MRRTSTHVCARSSIICAPIRVWSACHTLATGDDAVKRVYAMRKRAVGLLGNVQGEARPQPFVEDTAVPPENLAAYIAEFRALLDGHGLQYGMFGHVDAGVLHVRPALDMKDPKQAALVRPVSDAVAGHAASRRPVVGRARQGRALRICAGVLRRAVSVAAATEGRVRSAQPVQPGQDRDAAGEHDAAAEDRRSADARRPRPADRRARMAELRHRDALQRQRRVLQLRSGRCDVPVVEGDARTRAIAEGAGVADARMVAPARAGRRGRRRGGARGSRSWAALPRAGATAARRATAKPISRTRCTTRWPGASRASRARGSAR